MEERARRLAREDLRENEALFLRKTAKLLGHGLEPAVVIHEMLHLLSELIGLNRGRIILRDEAAKTAFIHYAYGLTAEEIARGRYQEGEGITGKVLQTGQAAIVQDISNDPEYLERAVPRSCLPPGTVSYIALPLVLEGAIIGVLAAHRLRARPRALADDLQILSTVAILVTQVIHLNNLVAARTARLESENRELRFALSCHISPLGSHGIIGNSSLLRGALGKIERVAKSPASVLLLGESGTGKELFARALHLMSARHKQPFVKINCGAIPENLFESELFGHERGAFTGAQTARAGRFEQAHGGTLFLDEVADIPLPLQVKLLRVLQERVIERLGGQREIPIDVRIVAATNQDLQALVRSGGFRLDLFYRLNVAPIRLPALRERPEDIRHLAEYHLKELASSYGRNVRLSAGALQRLMAYQWPGNVRQLRNVIERLVLFAETSVIDVSDVEQSLAGELAEMETMPGANSAVRAYEHPSCSDQERIQNALAQHRGNKSQAAKSLGLTLRQLNYRLKLLEDMKPASVDNLYDKADAGALRGPGE